MTFKPLVVEVGKSVDFRSDEWDVQFVVQREIRYIPRRVGYRSQNFGLQPLDDLSMGRLRAAPELYPVRPDRLEHAFVQKKFVGKGKL